MKDRFHPWLPIGEATSAANTISNAVSVVSAALADLASVHNVLSNRVSANSGAGGGGSVTSDELSIVSVVAADALSVANAASNAASAAEVHASTASAAATSVDGRATSLANAISVVSAAIATGAFYPTTLSVNAGTLVSGTTADLSALEGSSVLVSEVAATPGLLVTMRFSAVTLSPTELQIYGAYKGTHVVNVDIWNQTAGAYSTLGILSAHATLNSATLKTFPLPSGGSTYVSASNAVVRLNHLSAGLGTHALALDYVGLVRTLQAGATDHGALGGLADNDHPQYYLVSDLSAVSAKTTAAVSVRGLQSVVDAVSARVSAVEVHASAASAAATSVDGRATSLETRLSTVSGLAAAASAAAVAADGHANTASAAATSVDARLNSALSTTVSAIEARVSALSAIGIKSSMAGVSVDGLPSAIGAISVRLSALEATPPGSASVTSNELSAAAATLSVRDNSVFGDCDYRAGTSLISGNALVDLASMSFSVASGGAYEVRGAIIYEKATSGGAAFGISVPALAAAGSFMRMDAQASASREAQGSIGGASVYAFGWQTWSAQGPLNTAIVSVSVATVNVIRHVEIHGFLIIGAANGSVQIMARGSVAGDSLSVRGGYIRAVRVG